ncbi:hypothetical protein DMUE_6302, partial [Dictyocoela muelleri]
MINFMEQIETAGSQEFLNYLITNRLIREAALCDFCSEDMVLKPSNDNILGYNRRCLNYHCQHYQTTQSVLRGSFLEKFRTSPKKVLQIIYLLCIPIEREKITHIVSASKTTISAIKKAYITSISEYFINYPIKLGGLEKTVHIDETMLNHTVRSHRGRSPRTKCWAITMVDTSTNPGKGYAEIVASRNASTLMPIIERVIRNNTTIHT